MTRDPGLDFSFSGLKTALLYRCRELGPRRGARSAAPTSPPASRRRSSASWSPSSSGRSSGATGRRSRSAAASPPTGRCASAVGGALRGAGLRLKLVPLALCTDNAAMIGVRRALRRADPLPGLPRLRRLRERRAPPRRRTEPDGDVVLYARPGCHLCDEALRRDRGAARARATASSCGRSTSRATTSCCARYLERIPVVELDGESVSELDPGPRRALRARLDTVRA